MWRRKRRWLGGSVSFLFSRPTHQSNREAKCRPSTGRGPGSCSVQEGSSLGPFGKGTRSSWRLRAHGSTKVENSSPTEQGAMPALLGANNRHTVPLLFYVLTSRSSVPCRFGLSTETRCRHRKLCFFIAAHFFVTRSSAITARHTISQCYLATNSGIIFLFSKITPQHHPSSVELPRTLFGHWLW